MAAKGVYLVLREGVTRATLPDNRTMVKKRKYLISVDDFQRLSRSVRESVVSVEGIETKSYIVNHAFSDNDLSNDPDEQYIDLSQDGGSDEQLASSGWKAGQVLQGLNGEAFKLCKVMGGGDAGDVLVYESTPAHTVIKGEGTFAGVLVGDTADAEWGWVQTEGIVSAAHAPGVGAGDSLKVTTDGKFDTAEENGDTVATALSTADGDDMIEAALRSTRVRNRYVKRPNLFYPGQ